MSSRADTSSAPRAGHRAGSVIDHRLPGPVSRPGTDAAGASPIRPAGPLTSGGHGHSPAAFASLLPETAPSRLWFDARGSEGFYSAGRHIRHAHTGQSNPGTDHAAQAVHQQQRAVVVEAARTTRTSGTELPVCRPSETTVTLRNRPAGSGSGPERA